MAATRLGHILPLDRGQRAALGVPPPAQASEPTEIQGTRWRGASRTLRSLQNWLAHVGSATSDLPSNEQRTLRARSRDAFRNHPIARAALVRPRTAIVGTGLVCRPSVDYETLGITAEEGETCNTQIRTSWERWAEDPLECDIEATLDIYGLQGLALLSGMSSGDVFALTPMEFRAGGVSELKVQLIEADRVSNPNDAGDTPSCIDGIEFSGALPVGCWVRNIHPGDRIDLRQARWDYYPMFGGETGRRRVLHIWNDKERPGQVRGAPFLAPILEPLKQLDRFSNAELMAAVISAMLTVFIERDGEETDESGNPLPAFGEGGALSLGNGAIVDLAPGEKANAINPARPNANFDPFFLSIVKQVGAALEIPLDVLLLQFDASYSAARAAMLEAWRMFLCRRQWLVQQFCQPIFCLFLDEEVASGRLRLLGYSDPIRRRAWQRALWVGPARGSMDEEKEAAAAKTRIEIGVSNEAMETAAMTGEDWTTVITQRAREKALRKTLGVESPAPLAIAPAQPGHPAPPQQPAPVQEDPAGDGAEDDIDTEQDPEKEEEEAAP
ncbi:phage portal protein [Lysobacter enzymogenes]|uniref:phage portal protein n=1 Tax=Lysobacter enzymogenes TaxID=69 RepID=UPI001F5259BB|nr:phage portal protein [Lysobacter enzymogenes]UZW62748.1 phage portal protein [Lysobacter enzymogenes]